MELLGFAALTILNIVCFYMGAKIGQKVVNGEKLEVPSINPMEAYRKREAKKEVKIEQDKLEAIMHNIECYDGTGAGQKDVG